MQQTLSVVEKKSFAFPLASLVKVLGASLFLAAAAQVAVPLPMSPVPVSLQTLAVLLIGTVLGRKLAAYAILAYFTEVFLGLPFLAGGAVAPWALIGMKGGYLAGFLVQAFCMGWYCERQKKLSYFGVWAVASSLCMATLLLGSLWLGVWLGWEMAMSMGFAPFVLGELLKAGCVASFAVQYRTKFCA